VGRDGRQHSPLLTANCRHFTAYRLLSTANCPPSALSWRIRDEKVLFFAFAAATLLGGCSCNNEPSQKPPPNVPPNLPVAERPRQGGLDVTFIFAADTHFGVPGMDELTRCRSRR